MANLNQFSDHLDLVIREANDFYTLLVDEAMRKIENVMADKTQSNVTKLTRIRYAIEDLQLSEAELKQAATGCTNLKRSLVRAIDKETRRAKREQAS